MWFRCKGKFVFLFIGIMSIVVSLAYLGVMFFLPNCINLLEGEEHNFSMGLPLSAEFSNENIGVLNVNNEPVSGNIHLSLNDTFSVKSEGSGHAEVSLSLFGIPVKTVAVEVLPKTELIPCGNTVGVTISTSGVMVLGTGYVNGVDQNVYEPAKGILKSGDLITMVGETPIEKKEDLMTAVKENGNKDINLVIKRDGTQQNVNVTPVKSHDDDTYKIGIWIRDSTQGIGTVTYYNPNTKKFGALGHGIYDVDTKQLMSIKTGEITKSDITGIKKGSKGVPGELLGSLDKKSTLGDIKINTEVGLFGEIDKGSVNFFPEEKMEIKLQQDVKEGEAVIRSNIMGDEIGEYKVNIESINRYSTNEDKSMVVKITDERLLNKTNGIVQGMSGSPIIQDGKLIGALTHVFVQDPTKGYGIFIENMLKEEHNIDIAA